jgi:hypothetical protein
MEPITSGNGRHGPRLRFDPTIRIDLLALVVMAASLIWMGADMRNDIDHNTAAIAELSTAMRSLVAVDARLTLFERNLERLSDRVQACERRAGLDSPPNG